MKTQLTPKMVVNGIFQSDTVWRIHVSSSRSVIDSASFNNVVNASVLIEDDNGNIIDVLAHDTNGFYIGNTIPQENLTYNLSIIHPTLDDITSRNEIPLNNQFNRNRYSNFLFKWRKILGFKYKF